MTDIFMVKGNQDPDWQAGWDTMNALLWSLAPKHGRAETTLFLRALPHLLSRLQEGCIALGVPTVERDAFFERLAMLHAAVAREGLQAGSGNDSEGAGKHLDDAEGVVTSFNFSELPAPTCEPRGAASQDAIASSEIVPSLKVGSRIRLRVGREDKVLMLNWLSPMGGMYLFTNEEGLDAMTLTKARLVSKFRQGEAQLVV